MTVTKAIALDIKLVFVTQKEDLWDLLRCLNICEMKPVIHLSIILQRNHITISSNGLKLFPLSNFTADIILLYQQLN